MCVHAFMRMCLQVHLIHGCMSVVRGIAGGGGGVSCETEHWLT